MNSEKDKVMIAVLGIIVIVTLAILLTPFLVNAAVNTGVDLGAKL